MHLQKLCEYIARGTYNNLDNYISDNVEDDILRLGKKLGVIVIYLLLLPVLIFTGVYFDILKEVILATISIAVVRIWNGGNHFNTPDSCLVITTCVILINPMINHYDPPQVFYLTAAIFSLVTNLFLSPYNIDHNRNHNIHKVISCAACISSYFLSHTVLLTFFILSFDLIYRNQRLKRIWGRM